MIKKCTMDRIVIMFAMYFKQAISKNYEKDLQTITKQPADF